MDNTKDQLSTKVRSILVSELHHATPCPCWCLLPLSTLRPASASAPTPAATARPTSTATFAPTPGIAPPTATARIPAPTVAPTARVTTPASAARIASATAAARVTTTPRSAASAARATPTFVRSENKTKNDVSSLTEITKYIRGNYFVNYRDRLRPLLRDLERPRRCLSNRMRQSYA